MRTIGGIARLSLSYRSISSSSAAGPRKTALHDIHVKNGGNMVEYGGFEMPVLYKSQSISDSVIWTRNKASLFDVGHMQQHRFTGPDVLQYLHRLVPTDLEALKPYRSSLSVLLNSHGGIIDDLMITKLSEREFYIVTNATRREADIQHFREEKHDDFVQHHLLDTHGLVALQGPSSSGVLQSLTSANLSDLKFGTSTKASVAGVDDVLISRGGYTGEDGFEISIPGDEGTIGITEALLESEEVKLAGLAARDSLRLEAGLCLYGHDLDEHTSPIEAGLSWLVAKNRTGYLGYEDIKAHLEQQKALRRRVGLIVEGAPARELAPILSLDGEEIGIVTSGGPSPTLNENIAMGYVPAEYKKSGTEVQVKVRGKPRKAVVTKMPFVPTKYFK